MKDLDSHYMWVANSIRGLAVGLVVGVFITLFANTIFIVSDLNSRYRYIFLLMPLGAILTMLLYKKFGSNYKKTTVFAIDEIHGQEERREKNLATSQNVGAITPLMGLIGYISATISHLFGASVGKEGVGVQIGISIGALLDKTEDRISELLGIRDTDRTAYYLMSGASAAFGALFGSPIAGILFGLQFASPDILRLDALLPCTFASFSATFLAMALNAHILDIPPFETLSFTFNNLLYVVIFSMACGFFVRFFCFAIEKCKMIGSKQKEVKDSLISTTIPAFIAVAIITINLVFKKDLSYNGLSTGLLYNAISADVPLYSFLVKALLILLCTLSGFVGGEVVPLLVLGSTFGYSFSVILHLESGPYAVLGALAMLTGGTKLPLVCFMLGIELFGYSEPLLLFLACAVSYTASGKLGIYDHQRNSIYSK